MMTSSSSACATWQEGRARVKFISSARFEGASTTNINFKKEEVPHLEFDLLDAKGVSNLKVGHAPLVRA